jgi:iron complex transport system permease protein
VKSAFVFAGLASVILFAFCIDLTTGPAALGFDRVMAALAGIGTPADQVIVRGLRLPVALMAILVGAALGIAGAIMQTTLDNPLASPFTMGLSAAAGLGATAAIVLQDSAYAFALSASMLSIPAAALAATLVASFAIEAIGRWRGMTRDVMVLAGISIMFLCQSLQSLMQLAASPDALPRIVTWFLGDLQRASFATCAVVAAALALMLPLALNDAWKLTALRMGEVRAEALGVRVAPLKRRSLGIVALLTAAAVCFVGTVGFIGLVAPHLARSLVGEDHRLLLPTSALAGSALLSAASAASKMIIPGVALPITVVTALIGVPFLFLLIHRAGRSGT